MSPSSWRSPEKLPVGGEIGVKPRSIYPVTITANPEYPVTIYKPLILNHSDDVSFICKILEWFITCKIYLLSVDKYKLSITSKYIRNVARNPVKKLT